jgi:hypothetical protein
VHPFDSVSVVDARWPVNLAGAIVTPDSPYHVERLANDDDAELIALVVAAQREASSVSDFVRPLLTRVPQLVEGRKRFPRGEVG